MTIASEFLLPRFNVAPSQLVPVIRAGESGNLVAENMKWGFVPFWDESEKPKIAPINIRSEEMFSKPMFRQALQRRRILIPMDGFYEWQKPPGGVGAKTPYLLRVEDGTPFVVAGIYEQATALRPDPTFALLTTLPNELMVPIHARMPAILDREAALRWVRPSPITKDELLALIRPFPAARMTARRISPLVNNARFDGPEIIASLD